MATVPCVLLQSEKLDVLSCDCATMMATHHSIGCHMEMEVGVQAMEETPGLTPM